MTINIQLHNSSLSYSAFNHRNVNVMNLFIVALNFPREMRSVALEELGHMKEIYPQLDSETTWRYGEGGTVFAAGMHTAFKVASPRRYVWSSGNQITFYDGCIIDRNGSFSAHDAQMLCSNWERLPDVLEGQFVAVRFIDNPPCIEVMTDPLGMEQVYYICRGDMWLVSNSVNLISRISKASALDSLGLSLFLSIGWVGGDRTLKHDIRVIPGGQRWIWQQGNAEPEQKPYFSPSGLTHQRERVLRKADVERLAEELKETCHILAKNYGDLKCALTGGRDSRLLASVLIGAGIPANYYTSGAPSSADVEIGTHIAKTFNLPHTVNYQTANNVLNEWESACWRLINQHDGMISLWQIADVLGNPSHIEHLNVNMWGIGGEIARGFYSEPEIFVFRYGKEAMQQFLIKRLKFEQAHDSLISRKVLILTKSYLQRFVERAIDEGIPPLDVPDVFYMHDRVRRWAGSNARKGISTGDRFSLLCTRSFVQAAFTIPALHRYSESLHYELIKLLVPELHSVPFEKGPWRSQQPIINLIYRTVAQKILAPSLKRTLRRVIRRRVTLLKSNKNSSEIPVFDRTAWLESKLAWIRELCLDQPDSELWDFVDKPTFERITSATVSQLDRRPHVHRLYDVATLFYYART